MSDSFQRWASLLLGAVVIAVIGWITLDLLTNPRSRTALVPDAAVVVDAGTYAADASVEEPSRPLSDGGLDLAFPMTIDAGGLLPVTGGPRSLKLGVILVNYAGAEGAPTNARSKRDAQAIAGKLAEDAKADFKKALAGGDSGSMEDIGRVPRGVLDPRTEAQVWNLAVGQISDVLDTPRGYWIVKRIE